MKKYFIGMLALIVVVVVIFVASSFTAPAKTTKVLSTSWFQYVGPNYTSTELAKQENYEKMDGEPSCITGTQRCAIQSNIEVVNGTELPEDDASHQVVYSAERKFTP